MMKAKLRCFSLAVIAASALLLSNVNSTDAFELLARRSGGGAAQKCDACQKGGDACQKGACQKGAYQKGACQKGACQKGGDACQKGACQKGVAQKGCDACQKGVSQKGAHQKGAHQKHLGAHQKGAVQKGGKGKDGGVSFYGESMNSTPYVGAPVPGPIFQSRGA